MKWPATVCTPTRIAPLLSLKLVLEECSIPTLGRAKDFSLSSDGVPNALVQKLATAVALLGDVEPQASHVDHFFRVEFHVQHPFGVFPADPLLHMGSGHTSEPFGNLGEPSNFLTACYGRTTSLEVHWQVNMNMVGSRDKVRRSLTASEPGETVKLALASHVEGDKC